MSDNCPHKALRAYLRGIDAPDDAYETITKVLGWRPPPIWEAPREKIPTVNQAVTTPTGMRHVGWYCEHPLSNTTPYGRLTAHRSRKNNKRGWTESKNTSKALTFSDYDQDIPICPQQVPIYVNDAATALRETA